MKSIYQNLGGPITMPQFKGRKLYMYKMPMNEISLPLEFKDYERTVDEVLSKIPDRNNVCYITIDEKVVKNETHRRGGVHCDFNWYENIQNWGDGGGNWKPLGNHSGDGGGNGGHKRKPNELGGMLLLSNHAGCQVWKGEFDGEIGEGGDCSKINLADLQTEIIPAGLLYYLNPLGIHEGIVIKGEVERSLLRINFHPDYSFDLLPTS